MADQTINAETVTTAVAADDELLIWRAANGDTRKITRANFVGAVFTGGGTIATGGFTLTIGANSTINGTLSGGGTVATGGFTLTVPATGTASLLATAQTYTAVKTFDSGLSFGQTTIDHYEEGTWTPEVADASSGGNVAAVSASNGWYVRIGKMMFVSGRITGIDKTGLTAGNTLFVRGLPYASSNLTNYRANGTFAPSGIATTPDVCARISNGVTYLDFIETNPTTASPLLTISDLVAVSGSVPNFTFQISYQGQ